VYEDASTWFGNWGEEPAPPRGADPISSASDLFQTSAQLVDIMGEGKLRRDLQRQQARQRRFERSYAKRLGKKTRLDQLRSAKTDQHISALQNLVQKRRRARMALWGSVAILALVAFVAFRSPPTVRVAAPK
jgi:hypothetical protein